MRARLVTCTVASDNPYKLAKFYEDLLGIEMGLALAENQESYHNWISAGVKLTINKRHHPDERVMLHFAVSDIGAAITEAKGLGGSLAFGPQELSIAPSLLGRFRENYAQYKLGPAESVTGSLGKLAVIDDPEHNPFGLIELNGWSTKLFAAGEVTKFELVEQIRALESGRIFAAELQSKGVNLSMFSKD